MHLNGFPTVELSLLNLNHSCSSSWRLMVGAMLHTQPSCTLSAKFRFVGLPVLSTTLVSSGHSVAMQHFKTILDAKCPHNIGTIDFAPLGGFLSFPPPHQPRTRVVGHFALSTTLVSSGHSSATQHFQMFLDVLVLHNTGTLDFAHLGCFRRFPPLHQPRTRVVGRPVLSTTLVSSGHSFACRKRAAAMWDRAKRFKRGVSWSITLALGMRLME